MTEMDQTSPYTISWLSEEWPSNLSSQGPLFLVNVSPGITHPIDIHLLLCELMGCFGLAKIVWK